MFPVIRIPEAGGEAWSNLQRLQISVTPDAASVPLRLCADPGQFSQKVRQSLSDSPAIYQKSQMIYQMPQAIYPFLKPFPIFQNPRARMESVFCSVRPDLCGSLPSGKQGGIPDSAQLYTVSRCHCVRLRLVPPFQDGFPAQSRPFFALIFSPFRMIPPPFPDGLRLVPPPVMRVPLFPASPAPDIPNCARFF